MGFLIQIAMIFAMPNFLWRGELATVVNVGVAAAGSQFVEIRLTRNGSPSCGAMATAMGRAAAAAAYGKFDNEQRRSRRIERDRGLRL